MLASAGASECKAVKANVFLTSRVCHIVCIPSADSDWKVGGKTRTGLHVSPLPGKLVDKVVGVALWLDLKWSEFCG